MNELKNPPYVFLDTNVLVALYNKKDLLHKRALKVFKILSAQKARLVISNYVLLEIYTILSQRAGKRKAIEFGRMVRSKKPFLIKRITEELEEKTWEIFKKIKDKNLSFVDCSVIAVVLQEDCQLLSFDKKIIKLKKQFGFRLF